METQFDSDEKTSLFDFLPDNTVVWMQDWALTKEKLITQEEDLHLFLNLQKDAAAAAAAASAAATAKRQGLPGINFRKDEEETRLVKINIKDRRLCTSRYAGNTITQSVTS